MDPDPPATPTPSPTRLAVALCGEIRSAVERTLAEIRRACEHDMTLVESFAFEDEYGRYTGEVSETWECRECGHRESKTRIGRA
jgi:hypothetical protein